MHIFCRFVGRRALRTFNSKLQQRSSYSLTTKSRMSTNNSNKDNDLAMQKWWSEAVALAKRVNSFVSSESSMSECKLFFIAGKHIGYLRPDIWKIFEKEYGQLFVVKNNKEVHLTSELDTCDARSDKVQEILLTLRNKNLFITLRGWRDERFDIQEYFGREPLMKIERSACCLFGAKQYSIHVNGYVRHPSRGICYWVAKRSKTKTTWPGRYDNLAAGGLTSGLGIKECTIKEAQEEADISDDVLENLRPAGSVSFIYEDERGVFPELQFVWDLELPVDFQPHNTDGEVESFELWDMEKLKKMCVTDAFKPTSALAVVDFLIRQGHVAPDEDAQYVYVVQSCHTPVG